VYTNQQANESTAAYYIKAGFTESIDIMSDVVVNKYLLKDKSGSHVELNPDDMHRRLAKEFFRIENKYESNNRFFETEDEIYYFLKDFKYIVPQGSPMFGIGNSYVNVSLSNCVVVESPEDSMTGIMNTCKDLANLMKRRCGVGVDISTLRPEGAPVNNSALTTTGAWSFADLFSFVCRSVGQNGRRGALMISINCKHPDVLKFITMKNDKTKVTGANVSILCTDEFMRAVDNDTDFTLQWPVDSDNPVVTKTVRALDLWNMIGDNATFTAEPGVLLWDTILKYLPANYYPMFRTIATNPCGEIPLSAYDSCRLISVNLANMVFNKFTAKAHVDWLQVKSVFTAAMRLSDDLVDLEIEKIINIINVVEDSEEKLLWGKLLDAARNGRRTGLGTHGLADMLAQMCIKYDSEEALEFVDKLYKTIRDTTYGESINLARERGAFPVFDHELEKDCPYIKNLPENLQEEMRQYGRRNIAILTNAPTGSTALVSGNVSSGCEPVWKNWYTRRVKLSDHNSHNDVPDFVDEMGDKWKEYRIYQPNLVKYFDLTGQNKDDINAVIPDYFVESGSIDWINRVKLQGVMQKYIDHSISSTINLPAGTDPSVVKNIYMEAWKHGLKGVTVYVDGCRSGVLISDEDASKKPKLPQDLMSLIVENGCLSGESLSQLKIENEKGPVVYPFKDKVIPSLVKQVPDYINSDMSVLRRGGKKFYLHTSHFVQDKELKFPVAVWCQTNNVYDNGEPLYLNKARTKFAAFMVSEGINEDLVIAKVEKVKLMSDYIGRLTKLISMALRHNIPLVRIVDALEDIDGDNMFTSLSVLRKFLASKIEDGTTTSGSKCPECKSVNLIYTEGCKGCKDCGYSACS